MSLDWDSLVNAPVMDAFAEPITWQPAAGGAYPIRGIFDRAFNQVTITGTGEAVTSTHPCLQVRLSELPAPPLQSDRAFVPSVNKTYAVREVQPDGHGWALLLLNLAD